MDYGNELIAAGYDAIKLLGKGSFGTIMAVYKGQQIYAAKIVDSKKVPVSHAGFAHREMLLWKQLIHPNIAPLFMFEEIDNGLLVFLSEYSYRGDLLKLLKENGRLDEGTTRLIMNQVICAVMYMHGIGMAHRDIKPENVLVFAFNQVKLIDFGLSSQVDLHVPGSEMSSTFGGTLAYQPPEILQRLPHNIFRSDVWALGVLLFELVVGDLPFFVNEAEDMAILMLNADYVIPVFVSDACSNAIRSLLVCDGALRPTLLMLQKHPFFH